MAPMTCKQLFSYANMKKNPSLLAIAFCVVMQNALTLGSLTWCAARKDYKFIRSRPGLEETFDLLHPWRLKILIIDPRALWPKPKLHQVYVDMATEERKRKRQEALLEP